MSRGHYAMMIRYLSMNLRDFKPSLPPHKQFCELWLSILRLYTRHCTSLRSIFVSSTTFLVAPPIRRTFLNKIIIEDENGLNVDTLSPDQQVDVRNRFLWTARTRAIFKQFIENNHATLESITFGSDAVSDMNAIWLWNEPMYKSLSSCTRLTNLWVQLPDDDSVHQPVIASLQSALTPIFKQSIIRNLRLPDTIVDHCRSVEGRECRDVLIGMGMKSLKTLEFYRPNGQAVLLSSIDFVARYFTCLTSIDLVMPGVEQTNLPTIRALFQLPALELINFTCWSAPLADCVPGRDMIIAPSVKQIKGLADGLFPVIIAPRCTNYEFSNPHPFQLVYLLRLATQLSNIRASYIGLEDREKPSSKTWNEALQMMEPSHQLYIPPFIPFIRSGESKSSSSTSSGVVVPSPPLVYSTMRCPNNDQEIEYILPPCAPTMTRLDLHPSIPIPFHHMLFSSACQQLDSLWIRCSEWKLRDLDIILRNNRLTLNTFGCVSVLKWIGNSLHHIAQSILPDPGKSWPHPFPSSFL